MTVINETYIHNGYAVEKVALPNQPVQWKATKPGEEPITGFTMRDVCSVMDCRLTDEYQTLKPTLVRMLKDYLHKLERDDYDMGAVGKMKEVNAVLDKYLTK